MLYVLHMSSDVAAEIETAIVASAIHLTSKIIFVPQYVSYFDIS